MIGLFNYLGISSFLISIFALLLSYANFKRDNPNVQIFLQWDARSFGSAKIMYDKQKLWGIVSVTNIGRRPIFVSHAYLEIPGNSSKLVIMESISGQKLLEGDPPTQYSITQDGLEEYGESWDKMRVVITDSTGKKYYSNLPKEKPSWAKKN